MNNQNSSQELLPGFIDNIEGNTLSQALKGLLKEKRDEVLLREKFSMTDCQGQEKSQKLIDWILQTGLEPATSPSPLPPISKDDIQLICWMAITQES